MTTNRPLASLALLLTLITAANAANWPAWRGPAATGSTPGGPYPTTWTLDTVSWKTALPGKGSSSPVVWDKGIYLTSPADGQDAVIACDLDGEQLWLAKLGPESEPKHRKLGSSCNSSPVTDGKGLFVYFKSGRFAALELDGTVRWSLDLTEKFGPENLFWDTGTSPVLADNNVILARLHGGDSWIAAFDKATGEIRWKQPRNYQAPSENDNGYTTPILFQERGRDALLSWGADHLTAHSAGDGELLWSCAGFNPKGTGYWPAIASPVLFKDIAIVPVGRDDRPGQAALHGIRLGGTGDVTETHRAWKREQIGVFVAALAEYNGRILLLRHRGGVACLAPDTGETLWEDAFPKSSASYYSSPVIADGVLYAAREDGVVFTARIGGKFELLGQNDMQEQVIASPVPAAGRILIRGSKHLFCIGK